MAGVTAQLDQEIEARQGAQQMLEVFYSKGRELKAQQAELTKGAGTVVGGQLETPESFAFKLKQQLEAQNRTSAQAQAMDYSALSFDIATETATETRNQMALAEKVKQKSSVSFFDSPITALENAFTMPWDEQALAGSTQKLKMLNDAKANLDVRLEGAAKASETLKKSVNEQTMATLNKALANRLAIQSTDAELAAVAYGVEEIHANATAGAAVTNAILTKQKFLESQEQRALVRENTALAIQQKQRLQAAAADDAQSVQYLKNALKTGMLRDGRTPPSDAELGRLVAISRSGGTTGIPAMANRWMEKGIMLLTGTTQLPDGDTISEGVDSRLATGYQPRTDVQRSVAAVAYNAVADGRKNSTDKVVADKYAAAVVDKWVERIQGNVVPGDTANAIAQTIPTFEAIASVVAADPNAAGLTPQQKIQVGTFSGLRELPGFFVLEELAAKHGKEQVHHQLVKDALTAAGMQRKISPQQAAITYNELYKKLLVNAVQQTDVYRLTGKVFKEFNTNLKTSSLASSFTRSAADMLVPTTGTGTSSGAMAVTGISAVMLNSAANMMSGNTNVNAAGDVNRLTQMFTQDIAGRLGVRTAISDAMTTPLPYLQNEVEKLKGK